MTATDTHTETHVDNVDVAAPVESDGLYRLVASNDHKMVGRLWIGASLLFLVGLTVLGVVLGLERVSLDDTGIFGSITKYFQGWVLFRTGIVFMGVLPLFVGIATLIVPLQVGSASIAFPRLAAASFWAWLFASIIHIASFLNDGGLGPAVGTRTEGTLLTIVSLGFMIIALLGASICIATTVIALRPTGMTLMRVPAFSWSMLVASSVWLFSLPVLLANLIYSYVDLRHWGPTMTEGENPIEIVRDPVLFGNPDELWARLEWAWSAPQVFAYAIPVLGILADIVPVSAKSRQGGRAAILSLIGLAGLLSFGPWAQSFLSRGAHPAFQADNIVDKGVFIYDELLYIVFALAIFIPVAGVLGGALDNIRKGTAPKPNAALLGAVSGALLLLTATIVGELRVLPRLLQLAGFTDDLAWTALHENNVFLSSQTAQLGLVVAASLAAAVGALFYWSPKIFGGYALEPFGMLAVMALLGGGLLIGLGDTISALAGQPDISVADGLDDIVGTMNVVAMIGAMMMVAGLLAMVGSIIPASLNSETLPDDPWDGHTLEWATPSPPPVGNFVEPIETITSAEPLLDEFEEVS